MSELSEAVALNHAAQVIHDAMVRKVDADFKAGILPSPNFQKYEASMSVVWESAIALAAVANHGQPINVGDGQLKLAHGFKNCDGSMVVTLTEDGITIQGGAHEGPSADDVRFERWTIDADGVDGPLVGRKHGFCDRVSRLTTQWG